METKDAYMFPVIRSAVLFSLYLVFKFLPKEYINMAVKAYFFLFGVVVLGQKVAQILTQVLSEDTVKSLTEHTTIIKLPFLTQPVKKAEDAAEKTEEEDKTKGEETPVETEPQTIEFNKLDLVGCSLASINGIVYLTTNHWATSNIFGIAFSIQGIELLGLGSFFNGLVLLVCSPMRTSIPLSQTICILSAHYTHTHVHAEERI